MTKLEDLAAVVELACLIEDRSDAEQRALLRTAMQVDNERNKFTVTNKRTGPASKLLAYALTTRVIVDDQREVMLSGKAVQACVDRAARWDRWRDEYLRVGYTQAMRDDGI